MHRSWITTLFRRDDQTGTMKLILDLVRRPSTHPGHNRRVSRRLVDAVVAGYQSVLSRQSDAVIDALVNSIGEGDDGSSTEGPVELVLELQDAHQRAMSGFCWETCDPSGPYEEPTVEVPDVRLNRPLTEANADMLAQHELARELNRLQTTESTEEGDAVRLDANRGLLQQKSEKLLADYRVSEVSRTGSVWQRARLLRQMMQHVVALAETTTALVVEAEQGEETLRVSDLPICHINVLVEPLDRVESVSAGAGGQSSTAIGATLKVDV